MREPGAGLLWIARLLCRSQSIERVVLPAVVDMRHEWSAAVAAGARGRAAWIRLRGVARVAQALVMQGAIDAWRGPVSPAPARDLAIPDLLVFTLVTFGVLCCSLMSPVRQSRLFSGIGVAEQAWVFALLLPAAAVSFLPASFLAGALMALGRAQGEPNRRASGRLLAASCLLTGSTFVLAAWVMPEANHRYMSMLRNARDLNLLSEAGPREQVIGELNRRVSELEIGGWSWAATRFRVERHKRFALPAGAPVFALLALALVRRGVVRRVMSCLLVALAVIAAYLLLLRFGEQASLARTISPVVGAWLGNAVMALVALALAVRHPRAPQAAAGQTV